MPNITVLRVSSTKRLKKPVFHFILWVGLLLVFILIYLTFFFDSVKYLESESVRFVRTANLKTLQKVIVYSVPVFNADINNRGQSRTDLLMGVFDYKKILQDKYPVLNFNNSYITGNDTEKGTNPIQNNTNIVKTESDESENKNPKIYSKTVLVKSGGIAIRNHTNYKIDIDKMLVESLKFKIPKKGMPVIILHTHTTEAYLPDNKNKIIVDEGYRTTSPGGNVTRVGLELKKQLEAYKINAFQDITIHDYPEYLGAYSRSLKTALKDLKKHPETKMIIDIHRDANGETDGRLRISAKINGSDAAKIMFVVGTDELGLQHKNWRENLKLAVKLQDKANKIFPGLCREIDLRKERFNQHSAPGALIVEVGGTGNTIIEAERSMKYLARIISETLTRK